MVSIVKEAIEAVYELNEDVDEIDGLSEQIYFSAETNGTDVHVLFLGSVLWSSQDEVRVFNEELNEYEPLAGFIRKERDKLIKNIKLYEGIKSGYQIMYAAGFRDTTQKDCLSMGMFAGPSPYLNQLLLEIPPIEENGFPAYIVRLEKNDTIPVAKWNGEGWILKKDKNAAH